MVTVLKVGALLVLCLLSPWLLLLAPFLWWGGDASVAASHAVASSTGSEAAGNGCGWLVLAALFVVLAFLILAGLAVTMPADCRTIATNVAMGRCP